MMFQSKVYKLKNSIQNYAWGSTNEEAFIPKLLNMEIEKDKPYAELWIGAHPKAPSSLEIDGKEYSLNDLIKLKSKEILGDVDKKFESKLPYLLKILSAGEALSIQAHPNKSQAEFLHKVDPANYPDDNHKPEIAVALDDLQALIGFRTPNEIIERCNEYEELTELAGSDKLDALKKSLQKNADVKKRALKSFYSAILINAEEDLCKLKKCLDGINSKIKNSNGKERDLFITNFEKYGYDIGLISIFLLNIVELKKYEGVFLKAGIPHAYLKGNIVECMANSDNVVRAGLTPKFKDTKTLIDILTYEFGDVPVIKPDNSDNEFTYELPLDEFRLNYLYLKGGKSKEIKLNNKPIIVIVIEGSTRVKNVNDMTEFKKGEVFLAPSILDNIIIEAEDESVIFYVDLP